VSLNQGLDDLVAVALIAALAPLVVAVLPGSRIPQVVIFLLGGVLIGPHVVGLACPRCWSTGMPSRPGSGWR
jgi:Kef-type K+ transport system membrane component KefB